MTVIDRSAIDALHRMEEARKAREDRMRNALEILSEVEPLDVYNAPQLSRFVQRLAREGLGREPLPKTEG
jgi:hypothetical protein